MNGAENSCKFLIRTDCCVLNGEVNGPRKILSITWENTWTVSSNALTNKMALKRAYAASPKIPKFIRKISGMST